MTNKKKKSKKKKSIKKESKIKIMEKDLNKKIEVTEKQMRNAINLMVKSFKRSQDEVNKDVVKILHETDILDCPHNFDTYFMNKIYSMLDTCFRQFGDVGYSLADIYMHYNYYLNNITEIIKRVEGHACSVDKSTWLLAGYINYLKTGHLFDMEIDDECFWKPHEGTSEQWIAYMESLYSLFSGRTVQWTDAMFMIINVYDLAEKKQIKLNKKNKKKKN